jgi:hypothetical protein
VTAWVLDPGSSVHSDDQVASRSQGVFGRIGNQWARLIKSVDFEDRTGWNTVEVILDGDQSTHLLNGRVVNRFADIKQLDPRDSRRLVAVKSVRILLQAEGAEVWFPNVQVKPLKPAGR